MNNESPKEEKKKKIEFKDIKHELGLKLNDLLKGGFISGEDDGFTMIEGILMQPIQNEISSSLMLCGPTVPSVAIVGNKSGRIYYFALKKLLPRIDLSE
jgi:hypothetical protein